MCGIFGILQHHASALPCLNKLERSGHAMQHRGPDGQGIFRRPGIGLVHTRLSLVDLDSRSNQPFWDSTGRYCLVYNGELYDFAKLRSRLEQKGIVFQTSSDTEVLLESLVHFGVDATLSQIEGMFAFGLYDTQQRKLTVARDRLGIKPCFVAHGSDFFAFGSTIRAIEPWLKLRPNVLAISAYLQGSGVPMSGRSFFDQVEMLAPGAILETVVDLDRVEHRTFFRLADLADQQLAESQKQLSVRQQIDRVESALFHSVASQMRADAPIGGLCSGGVDSSLVMAIAAQLRPGIAAFHADVAGPHSECAAAETVARTLRLDFHRVSVTDDDFLDLMPHVIDHYGHPFTICPNAVPLYRVAQLAHQAGIKAALCGEGADECYLGYPWLVPNVRAYIRHLPKIAYRTLTGWIYRRERHLRGKGNLPVVSFADRALVLGMQTQFERDLGPQPDTDQEQFDELSSDQRKLAHSGDLSFVLRSLMHRNDSMGMAHGLETRYPFLNNHCMRMAVNLPLRAKIRPSPTVLDWSHLFMQDKWILRQVAARYLPREISHRKKIPFPTGVNRRMEVAPEFFQASFVSDLFGLNALRTRHLLRSASHALRLRLLHLDLWGRLYFRGAAIDALGEQVRRHVSLPGRTVQTSTRPVIRKKAA